MKIVWLSANKLGFELLKESFSVVPNAIHSVITLSDKATTVMYDGIESSKWAEFGIPIHYIEKINDSLDLLEELSPDLVIMCGWRQIISDKILSVPKKGFVGFHPTLLPKGRGSAPIINSILQPDFSDSGLTLFSVTAGLDNGDIISQKAFEISKQDYASDVYDKLILTGKKIIQEQLPLLFYGTEMQTPQNEDLATIFPKIKSKDNEIDLEKDSLEKIRRKIRAFSKPYKGAYIKLNSKKIILWNAEVIDT